MYTYIFIHTYAILYCILYIIIYICMYIVYEWIWIVVDGNGRMAVEKVGAVR